MRMVLAFYGSRGDIQPGLAFGLELQSRGHDVALAVPPNFVDFARRLGLAAHPVGLDTSAVWDTPRAQEILRTRNLYTKVRLAKQAITEGFAAFDADVIRLLCGPDTTVGAVDALVSGPLCQERVFAISEQLGVRFTVLRFGPFSENGVIGAIPGVSSDIHPAVNRASWRMMDSVSWTFGKGAENGFRKRIDLPDAKGSLQQRYVRNGVTQIQAYDSVMFPGLAEEWGENKPIVGYLDLPADIRGSLGEGSLSDDGLWSWLTAGEPPVFVTVGSVPVADRDAFTRVITEAGTAVGCRLLVTMKDRPTGPDPADPGVYFAESLDHAAVLPLCQATVHHGGAGTTAAGLRASLPTMVCHGGADQAYWGAQVTRMKVGTSTSLKKLTTEKLVTGLHTILTPEMRENAALVAGAMIPAAKAVSVAADIAERTR